MTAVGGVGDRAEQDEDAGQVGAAADEQGENCEGSRGAFHLFIISKPTPFPSPAAPSPATL